ncbi:MAG: dTMP kinase [Candidatus Peribacteraceae bacterium]|nr:dTMP kinase [Candidatus Peribacteraceae bacterium]MDD5742647.1 dTMP kinase [Candidatus Peribacteraceae bacterium]
MRGIFIVLEGPDGAGTTKHSKLLGDRLTHENHAVLCTFEPTDGPVGSTIRSDLRAGISFSPFDLQTRFCDDRTWHVNEVIEPALARGTTVISDRYFHSTIVYGLALGIPRPQLDAMNTKFIRPDVTLFLLPPFAVLQERMSRRDHTDALERSELQKKVCDAYRTLATDDPSIIVIDSSGELEEVAEQIYQAVAVSSKQ